jgi:hypothetical protein
MMPHARLTEAEIEALRFYTWSRYVKIRIICNGMKQICKNPASNILGNGKSLQGQNIHIDLPLDYGHLNLARSVTLEAEAWVTVVS